MQLYLSEVISDISQWMCIYNIYLHVFPVGDMYTLSLSLSLSPVCGIYTFCFASVGHIYILCQSSVGCEVLDI